MSPLHLTEVQAASARLQSVLGSPASNTTPLSPSEPEVETTHAKLDTRHHPQAALILRLCNLCQIATCGIGAWLALETLIDGTAAAATGEFFAGYVQDMRNVADMVGRVCHHLREAREVLLGGNPEMHARLLSDKQSYASLIDAATTLCDDGLLPEPDNAQHAWFQQRVSAIWDVYDNVNILYHGNSVEGMEGWKTI